MGLNILDQAPQVAPLLVKMYDSQKLKSLTQSGEGGDHAELVNAIVQLLDMELPNHENELIADVLISLVRQVELDLRVNVASRLASNDRAPLRLVLELANDDINVARPVLMRSVVLNDLDLIYIIKSQGAEYWRAIARRSVMGDMVVNTLAERRDVDTAVCLAENTSITMPEGAMQIISEAAGSNDRLARAVVKRDDVTVDILKHLYANVGDALKAYIIEHSNVDAQVIRDEIDGAIEDMQDDLNCHGSDIALSPSDADMHIARDYKDQDLLSVHIMIGMLRRNQAQTFIAHFSEFTNMDVKTVIHMMQQKNGQALAVSCRAHSIRKVDFVSLYLLCRRTLRDAQGVDVANFKKAISYFDRITPSMAKGIVESSASSA